MVMAQKMAQGIIFLQFRQDGSEKMVEYLRSSVGILHKNHAESITNFIKHTVDAELGPK
jgi:hypothetical protein